MEIIKETCIWKSTLDKDYKVKGEKDLHIKFRFKLEQAFTAFRDRAGVLAGEIPQDLKQLTVHDMTHIDALWQVADMIVGPNYPFTPTEAFVLGGAFLLHDLGMALASYPAGVAELQDDSKWRDAAVQLFRRKHGRPPRVDEMLCLDDEIKGAATERLLRLRHAEQAGRLGTTSYRHADKDITYYLIDDPELRQTYGELIGNIAYSHWWSARELPNYFDKTIGAFAGSPSDWTIDPLKLALMVRVADACHLDTRRAPGFLRALRKPVGESARHWRLQEYIQTPHVEDRQVVFSTPNQIPLEDVEVWWLGYDMMNLADNELREADMILRGTGRRPFAVDSVKGANDPSRLTRYFPTRGWKPVPTKIRVGDVAGLVRNLGGKGLYGDNPRVPLRELIQNSRDAVVARRIKEQRAESWGEITIRLLTSGEGHEIEILDTGLGMSEELLVGPFLDFGASYWNSPLMLHEHSGLISRGFEPQGQFGIGFFSVFMWGEHVKVITRRPEDGVADTRVMEFCEGLSSRPILRQSTPAERLIDAGTVVHIWLDKRATDPGGILAPGPIESRASIIPSLGSRETEWQLRDLCAWLCPTIDVDLFVEQDGRREVTATASDWETIPSNGLLRRLLLHRDDVGPICSSEIFQILSENITDIRDETGRLLGRAAATWNFQFMAIDNSFINEASSVTAGSFRTFELPHITGLLLGHPKGPKRSEARPSAFDCPDALSRWATDQSSLVQRLTDDPVDLFNYASILRLFGGDTCGLPIARDNAGILSFFDIAGRRDLPSKILLHEDAWGTAGFVPQTLPADGIAVSCGRMRPVPLRVLDQDPKQRANHPRWKQYWMSLWGATIEAIAQAWAVPLQEVLEASEFAAEGWEDFISEDGQKYSRPWVDIIEYPRKKFP